MMLRDMRLFMLQKLAAAASGRRCSLVQHYCSRQESVGLGRPKRRTSTPISPWPIRSWNLCIRQSSML